MRRRSLLAVAGWLATAAVATLIGMAAIRWVGESIAGTPGGVLSQEQVERALASPGPTAPAPGGPSSPAVTGTGGPSSPAASGSSPAGARRAFTTTGGSAVAECGPGGVRLVSWTPVPGYRVTEAEPGPDDDVEVTFVGPSGEFELKLRCVGVEPVSAEDDD
ncbi:septum formation initiator [Micromonospora sp. C31]|uniref:septum formation initiator n=1 Tax=Micromonospora sp. C31 TaxID=2824876 RepID=UPI001B38D85B|nr:septum formation initiator [Micromonospora sp. C31]MBQ1074853.1 septum formation initiator [Micromonospora sp. C31]